MKIAKILYGNIDLAPRDGEKVRGYLLGKYNDNLLHNHIGERLYYRTPKIQYKVINGNLIILGIDEGVELIKKIGILEDELNIQGKMVDVSKRKIEIEETDIVVIDNYIEYEFLTPWIAINQKSTIQYKNETQIGKEKILEKKLIGNILSLAKGCNIRIGKEIFCKIEVIESVVNIKAVKFVGLKGRFKVNVELPNYIGIGKAVSKGFGTIRRL